MFKSLADRPVVDERPASRIRLTESSSSVRPEDTVRSQFASIPAIVEDVVIPIFGEARRLLKSCLDTSAVVVVSMLANRSITKVLHSSGLQAALKKKIQYAWLNYASQVTWRLSLLTTRPLRYQSPNVLETRWTSACSRRLNCITTETSQISQS